MTAHAPRAMLSSMLFAVLLLLAAAPTRPPESAYAPLAEKDGVSMTIARQPGPHPWIHASAPIDAPCDRVAAIVTDFDHYQATFDPFYQKAEVLDRGDDVVRLHAVWHFPWPFRNRDAIIAYRVEHRSDGSVVVSGRDGERPGDPSEGVRIHDVDLQIVAVPSSSGACTFLYDYYADLSGNFGKSQNEKAYRGEAPVLVNAIRRALRK